MEELHQRLRWVVFTAITLLCGLDCCTNGPPLLYAVWFAEKRPVRGEREISRIAALEEEEYSPAAGASALGAERRWVMFCKLLCPSFEVPANGGVFVR